MIKAKTIAKIKNIGAKSLPTDFISSWELLSDWSSDDDIIDVDDGSSDNIVVVVDEGFVTSLVDGNSSISLENNR